MSVPSPPTAHTYTSTWYDLPAHWQAARWTLRARVALIPFITPAILLWDALLGAVVGALVMLICGGALCCRVLMQPFRRGRPTRLLAWRLPFAALLAGASVWVAISSYQQAKRDARDLIVELHQQTETNGTRPGWLCGEPDRCRIEVGYPGLGFDAWLSRRDEHGAAGVEREFQVLLYLGPDTSTTFTANASEGIEIVSRSDLHVRTLDPQTLSAVR